MNIYIRSLDLNTKIEVNPNDYVGDLRQKLYEEGIISYQFLDVIIFAGNQLEDYETLQHYSIHEGSTLHIVRRRRGGACPAEFSSKVIGLLEYDDDVPILPLKPGRLSLRYIRNTNSTGVYEQRGGTCYAYAACSAYINTIMQIYGSRPPPSFRECFEIACYNGSSGGKPDESIRLLEKHFGYGIMCDTVSNLLIRDALTISVIVDFSTSKEGWESVANGRLLKYPGGKPDGWHSALIEGYDLDKDCAICKNSWGGENASPRFDFTGSAAHNSRITRVYFTLESIKGKTSEKFIPRLEKCVGSVIGQSINCAWMDKLTAEYCAEYLCEFYPEKEGPLQYFGYNVFQWIEINLNRPKNQKQSRFYYANQKLIKQEKKKNALNSEKSCIIY